MRVWSLLPTLALMGCCPLFGPDPQTTALSSDAPTLAPAALPIGNDPCSLPNPARMAIAPQLMEPAETLAGGDFESGAKVPFAAGGEGAVAKAAHSGKLGWALPKAGTVTVPFTPEKVVNMEFSAWVRSAGAPIQARLSITPGSMALEGMNGAKPNGPRMGPNARPGRSAEGRPNRPEPGMRPGLPGGAPPVGGPRAAGAAGGAVGGAAETGEWVTIGAEWTQIKLSKVFTTTIPSATLTVETTGAASIDDVSIMAPAWKRAEGARTVGGIQVPAAPTAPFLFAILLHLEDDLIYRVGTERWENTTLALEKLAAVLHRHGGALTIQPELQWLEGAEANARKTGVNRVMQMTQQSGVYYSTHTHGPSCVDNTGRALGASDCRQHPEYSKAITDANTISYIKERQDALQRVTGQRPTDHNGNFTLASFDSLPTAGIVTLSGFKDSRDQSGLPSLYTNPWRPTGTEASENLDAFLKHNPNGPVVYLPGASVKLTRSPARLPDQLGRVIGQVLRFADAERVNTLYTILAGGSFAPPAGTNWDEYKNSGLDADIATIDTMLSTMIDPLVKEGYLKWNSLPEMGAAYLAQEQRCRTH